MSDLPGLQDCISCIKDFYVENPTMQSQVWKPMIQSNLNLQVRSRKLNGCSELPKTVVNLRLDIPNSIPMIFFLYSDISENLDWCG